MAHSATETSEHHTIVRVTETVDDNEKIQSSPALRRTSIAFKRSASRPYLFDSDRNFACFAVIFTFLSTLQLHVSLLML